MNRMGEYVLKKKIAISTLALIPLTATNVFASNQQGIVMPMSLNVRSGPSTDYPVVFTAKKNDRVTILQSESGWYKISSKNGAEGWAFSEYISTNLDNIDNSNKKIVKADKLNMRNGASTSYRIIAKINNGTEVEVISESNGWSKVKYDGRIGYVSSEFLQDINNNEDKENETLQTQPQANEEENTQKIIPDVVNDAKSYKTKIVKATSLNVRSGASTSHGIIGSLKQNEVVEVISESNGWSKIKFKGKEAYVSSAYLKNNDEVIKPEVKPEVKPETSKTKIVKATSLNVRSGASTSHGIIGSLKQNEVVEVISESNGWSKIKFKGLDGYASSKYLKDYDGDFINPDTGASGGSCQIIDGATVNYKPVGYSLQEHVNRQVSKGSGNTIASSGGFKQANKNDVQHFVDPNNFKESKNGILQFLRLDSYKGGISAGELNGYLNSLRPAANGTNVFYNQGQAFINAAKKYNLDLVYLVSHSMLETGYGRSTLAQGQILTKYQGKPLPHKVKVYNFFGIGALDGTANLSGAEAAYKNGWTTVEKTIDGSARWLSSNYIHSGKYSQNTLYKMRWSYEHLWHQYATDVNWANAIAKIMSKLIGMYDTNSNLVYDVHVHR